LVVGADGRTSTVRAQAGIPLHQAEPQNLVAGLLVDNVPSFPQDTFTQGTEGDLFFIVFPQGGQRARVYLCPGPDQRERYAGPEAAERFLGDLRRLTCLPQATAIADGTPIGPCATLGGEDTWTDTPFVEGVVLIGDAAGYNNPIIGQGLSLSMRDVRVLSELLVADRDWTPAGLTPYADERRERMRRMRLAAARFADVFATFGPEGSARRLRILSRLADPKDPTQLLFAPLMIGPHRTPDFAFTEEFRTMLLG
jgi:2-polyprenyl-6-methoxyphenol hydroxylase-like FAD-dependent oxidoreductase